MNALTEEFSFDKIGRAPARFDEAELALVNARLLHQTPYALVEERLEAYGVGGGEDFWNLMRANIEKLPDIVSWSTTIFAPAAGQIEAEDQDFCAAAANLLPDDITDETWGEWTKMLKADSGRKGKTLFMPLRRALTGRNHGPEMGAILKLLGAERARGRLRGDSA